MLAWHRQGVLQLVDSSDKAFVSLQDRNFVGLRISVSWRHRALHRLLSFDDLLIVIVLVHSDLDLRISISLNLLKLLQ